MAWDTATYLSTTNTNNQFILNVQISDSVSNGTLLKQYYVNNNYTIDILKNQILNDITALNNEVTFINDLVPGIINLTVTTVNPTAAQTFIQNYNTLLAMNRGIAAGLTIDTTSLKSIVQAAYLPEYLGAM